MAEHICTSCSRSFDSVESLKQHNNAKHVQIKENNFSFKKYSFILVLIIALGLFSYSGFTVLNKASPYDKFAECLKEKGVIYGNDFCSFTIQQLNMFGSSQALLNYVRCVSNKELCEQKGVKKTPTWYFGDIKLEGVQTFEKISEVSGCKIFGGSEET